MRGERKSVRAAKTDQFEAIAAAVREGEIDAEASLVELLETILKCVGAPVSLDHLILIVAELRGIKDDPAGTVFDETRIVISEDKPPSELERRERLEMIWKGDRCPAAPSSDGSAFESAG